MILEIKRLFAKVWYYQSIYCNSMVLAFSQAFSRMISKELNPKNLASRYFTYTMHYFSNLVTFIPLNSVIYYKTETDFSLV